MSYLTSLEKSASFPLRPAEQEEDVEVAEIGKPVTPALPGVTPGAPLPPVSDLLPKTGEKEKYTFKPPEGPRDNPFDIAFGSREKLASYYAEVVDTTAKQRYEAGQLAEKHNRGDIETEGVVEGIVGGVAEFLDTGFGGPVDVPVKAAYDAVTGLLSDSDEDKKEVLERTAVDTYMLEADEEVPGVAQVVLGESAIDPNSEAAKKLKEQGRSAKKIRTAEDIRVDITNDRLRQGFIAQAGEKEAGAQAYTNYVQGIIDRAREAGNDITYRQAQQVITAELLNRLPKEGTAVVPPLVTAQRDAVNLVSAVTEKGMGREAAGAIGLAPFRYFAGGSQQLGDRIEPGRVFDPYVEEDSEMKLSDPLGARARGPAGGGEAERAQFLAQQMFTPVDFAFDEDQSLQTSLTAAQTINDLIADGSLVLAATEGNFDDLFLVAPTTEEVLGSDVVENDEDQARFIALALKAGLPVDKAYGISRAESRGNPAAFAFNLHLGQHNPNDPDNPRNRTAEQERMLRRAMEASGLKVNLDSRAAQNYYGEDARRALDLAVAVNPVAAVQGGAFGEFQVTGKYGDALGYVKEQFPEVETDEQAAAVFLNMFKKRPGMVGDDMFARWFQRNPEAQKAAADGDLDALAAEYYGALRDPEEAGISAEESRRRKQQLAVRDSWRARVKEGSETYLAGMANAAREADQAAAETPETPTSDPKTLLAARGTREEDDYFTSSEYVQDRTQVEEELGLNAIEVETGVSTVLTMFSDMGEAPSPGSSAFIAAVEDIRNAKEGDPQLYQVVYDNKDAPMGTGFRNVANFLLERKVSKIEAERPMSDLTVEEVKELRAESRQEAFRLVTSAQTENMWRASFYTSFDYLLGEDEVDVIDAAMPRVEVMGRTKDGFVFRQEGNVMAGAAALDAPPVLGQSFNIGVIAGYTFPKIEEAYTEYMQGKRGAASLAFAVGGTTIASVAGSFAPYIPFSNEVGIEFVNEVHRAGVQGVAERQNFVEVGLHSASELFATAAEELLETETGRDTLEFLINSGSLPVPYELTTPARRYVAVVDMARATGTAVGMLGGLVLAVGVPDATDFLMAPKAAKTAMRAYRLIRDIDLSAEGADVLKQTGTLSRAVGLRPQMYEHGEARRTTLAQLATTLEAVSAKDLEGASTEDIASLLQLVDDILETSRRQDETDAVFRNDLTASIKVEVDLGAEDVLSLRATTNTPSGEAARHALDQRLSQDAHAVILELIEQGKNSNDPRRVELATTLEQRLAASELREAVSLSPGMTDALLKGAKQEAGPEKVFGFTNRIEILRDALLLVEPASDGMAIRKAVFDRRMNGPLSRVGNTAVEDLAGFVDPTLTKGLDRYGPVSKADLDADLATARLTDDKKAEIRQARNDLQNWHDKFKAAIADKSILDPQVRGALLNEFKTNKLAGRSYRIYKNSDNSRRGNLYRGVVRGVSGIAGDATNAAFGQNILTRALQGVLAAADARGAAYKTFAVALVDKNKLKAIGDGMTAEEFVAGGERALRMRRFRYAIQSGTVDGVMQIMLANPVMRRLIPKDALEVYKATYAASASARLAKRQEMLSQQKSPLDLARLLQKEELTKLTQRRAVAAGRGDQALVDTLTTQIDEIKSPQFFAKVSEWMDASISEMRAAQAEGRAANLPTLDLPIGIDPAIVNRMDMPVTPLSATRTFFRDRYAPAFGFKAEEEVAARALSPATRRRQARLSSPEMRANEVILDQMFRYMAGVDPTDSRVIAESKVEDFLERRLTVRSIGSFDFESRRVELNAQLDEVSEQLAQSRFGKAVDDLRPRERAQVRSDAFNTIIPLMSEYEAILIFTRSKEELDALLEQARFIGPRFRGEEADPNVILSTLFQDTEFQGRLAKVAEGASASRSKADVVDISQQSPQTALSRSTRHAVVTENLQQILNRSATAGALAPSTRKTPKQVSNQVVRASRRLNSFIEGGRTGDKLTEPRKAFVEALQESRRVDSSGTLADLIDASVAEPKVADALATNSEATAAIARIVSGEASDPNDLAAAWTSLRKALEDAGVSDSVPQSAAERSVSEVLTAEEALPAAPVSPRRSVRRRARRGQEEVVDAPKTPDISVLPADLATATADVAQPALRRASVAVDAESVDLSGIAKVDEALVDLPDSVVEAEAAFGNSALLWSSLSDAMDSLLTGGGKADALSAMGSTSGKALGSRALRGLGDQVLGVMAEGLRGLKAEESSDFFVKFAKALDSTSRFDSAIRVAVRDRPDFLVTLAEVFGKQARGPLTRADVAAVEDLLRQNSIPADELSAQDLLKVNGKENKAALAVEEAALADEAVQAPAATKATLPAEVERSPALEEAVDSIVKATGSDEIRVLLTDLKDSDHGRNIETVLQAIDMIGPERLKNISLVIEPADGQSAAKRMFDFTNETIRIYDDALESGEFSADVLSQLWQSLTRYVPDAEVKALKDEWIKDRDAFMRANPDRFGRDMAPIGDFAPNEMRFLSFDRWIADAARDVVIAEVAPALSNNSVLGAFVDIAIALVEQFRLRGRKIGSMALEFLRKDSQKYQEKVRSGSVDTVIRQPTPEEYFGEQLKWQAFLDNPEARKAVQEAETFEEMTAIDELIEGAAEATVKVVETFLSERLRRRVLLSQEGFDLLKAEVIKDDVQRVLFSGVADRLQQLGVSALNKNTQKPLSRFEMVQLFKEVRGKSLASAVTEDASLVKLSEELDELGVVQARLIDEGKLKTPEMLKVSERINELSKKISEAISDLDVSGGSLHERMLKITTEKDRREAAQSILDNVVPIIAKFDESDAPITLREVLAGVDDRDVVAEVRELLGIAGRRGDLTQFIGKDGELVLIRTPGRAVLPEDDIYMQTLRAEAEGRPYDVDQQLEAEVDAILRLRPDMPVGEARQKAAAYLAEMREEIVQSRRARHERGAYDYEMFYHLNEGDAAPLAAEARRTGLESGLSTKVDEVIAETPEAGTVPFKTTRKLADEFDIISFETTPGLEQAAFALSQAEILKKNPPKRPKRTKGESDEAFRARRVEQIATNQAAVITLVIDMFEGLRPYVALPAEITVKGKDISLKGILKGQDFSKLQVTDTKAFLKEYTRLIEDALKEQGVLEEAKTIAAAMQKNEFEDALVRAREEKVVEAVPAVEPAAARVEEPAPAAVEEVAEVVEEAAPAAPAAARAAAPAAPRAKIRRPDFAQILFRNAADRVKKANVADQAQRRGEIDLQTYLAQLNKISAGVSDEDVIAYNLIEQGVVSSPEQLKKFILRMEELNPSGNMSLDSTSPGRNAFFQVIEEFEAAAAEPKATPRPVVEPPKTTRSLPKAGEKHTPPTPAEARAETAAAPRNERGVPVEAPALKVEDLPKVDAVVKTYTDMGKTSPETLVEHAVARNIDPDDHATTSSLANAVGQADVKAARVAEAVAGDVTPTPAAAPTAAAPVAPSTVAPRAAAAADITADEQKVIDAVDDMAEALAPENANKIGRRAARLKRLIEETDAVEEMNRQQIVDYVFDDLDVGARETLANSGAIDDMVTDLRRIFNRNVKDVQYEANRLRRTAVSLNKLAEKLEGDEQDRALRAAARAEARAVSMEEALDEIMKSDRLRDFEDLLDAETTAGKQRRKDARKAKRERLAIETQEREAEIIDEPSVDIQAEVLRGIERPPRAERRVRARGDDDGRFLGGPPRPPGTPRTPRDQGMDKVPKDIKGMVYFTEESQAIIYAFKSADAETGLHETAHVLRRNLREADLKVSLDWVNSQLEAAGLEKVRLAYGIDSQVGNFVGRADSVHFAEEIFADGFTQYLREGVAPTSLMANVFKIMKDLLHNIFIAARRQPTKIEISPEMYEVFDRIFGAKKSFTINDMPDAMMFLNVQDDINNSVIGFGGRLETDLIFEDTVTDRFRQLEMSLDDYRRRMGTSGETGIVGKAASFLPTPETAVGGLKLGSRTSQYLDPVSSRVLSAEDRMLLNRFRRGEIKRNELPSRLLPEIEKGLRVTGEAAVLFGSMAMKAARLMYGDDASRALRAMRASQRVHATGGAREVEEFSNGLSVLINDFTRRWGDSAARAVDDLISFLSGKSSLLQTGSERGKRLTATSVDTFDHFFRMIEDMLWRMDPDARIALTQAAELRLTDPLRAATRDDILPLSGVFKGYVVRERANPGAPAKSFSGSGILLRNDYIDVAGPGYARGEKIQIDSHLQDTLGALFHAVTGTPLNDSARLNKEALDFAALMIAHAGSAMLKAEDGSAVSLDQVLKAADMSRGEAFVKGVTVEINGSKVTLPGLVDSSIAPKRYTPVLIALGHAGFAAGMLDDAAKWGFGLTGREYRSFLRYVTGQQGGMTLDEIEVAKSVITRFGVSAEFVLNERRLGQYYIPKQARDALREQMNQAARQFGFGPKDLNAAKAILGVYNSLLYSTMVFGAVVAKPFYRLASLLDLGSGAASMAGVRSGAAAMTRAGLGSALGFAYKGLPLLSVERAAEAAGRATDVARKVGRRVRGGEDTAEIVTDLKQRLRDASAEKGDALARVITEASANAKYRPEVRPIMEARPDMIFVVNGRPYRASDLRRIFVRSGLYNNMFKSIKATHMAEGGSLSSLWEDAKDYMGRDTALARLGNDFIEEAGNAKSSSNIMGSVRSAGDLVFRHGLESADAWADLERTGLAVTFMEMGYSPQTSARMVVEAVYDYRGSMTKADRNVFNRLTRPFFAFTKNAIHHVTNLMSSPLGRFYARSMAKLPFLTAEAATSVLYEFLVGPYGINTSAMNSSELNAYYDLRNFLEYGLGDQVDRETLNLYREILPDEAKDISDQELMDYDFSGWTIREGYNGYDNVPDDVRVSVRALIASRSKLYAKGQYIYVTKIMEDEKLRQEFVKLGGEMAVRDMPNRRGQASYMHNRYPTIQVPLPVLDASVKEAMRLGLDDSIFWMLPDNFVHSGMDEAGAMMATLFVLMDETLNAVPGGEPFIGDVAGARAVRAMAPLVDVRGYGSPLGQDIAKSVGTIAGADIPLFVEVDPLIARMLQGSMIPVANAEGIDEDDLGILGQIGQTNPEMMNSAMQVMAQMLGVGVRDIEFPSFASEVRAAEVVVKDGQREVVFIDQGSGASREFVDPENEALRQKPFLVGKSALFFKVTPLGMLNRAFLQYRATAQEDQIAAQAQLRSEIINFISAQGRQVGMRTAGSDEDRTTKSIERAANRVLEEYK